MIHEAKPPFTNPTISAQKLVQFRSAQSQPQSAVDEQLYHLSFLTFGACRLLGIPINLTYSVIALLHRLLLTSLPPIDISKPEINLQVAACAIIYLVLEASVHPLPSYNDLAAAFLYLLSPASSPLYWITSSTSSPRRRVYDTHPFENRLNLRAALLQIQPRILAGLNYTASVESPYKLVLAYLETFDLAVAVQRDVASEAFLVLNQGVLSPQVLTLTSQPQALAVAAVYLAAKRKGVELVEDGVEWWLVFGCEREELGFLVLSLNSCAVHAEAVRGTYK